MSPTASLALLRNRSDMNDSLNFLAASRSITEELGAAAHAANVITVKIEQTVMNFMCLEDIIYPKATDYAMRQHAASIVIKWRTDAHLRSGGGRHRLIAGPSADAPGAHRLVRRPRHHSRATVPRQKEHDRSNRDERAQSLVHCARSSRRKFNRQRLPCRLQRNHPARSS